MVTDLKNTFQSEGEGLNLELSLAPPSSSLPHHEPQRSESVKFPLTLVSSPLQLALSPPQLTSSPPSKHRLCIRSVNDMPIGPPYLWSPIVPPYPRMIYRQEAMIHELAPWQLRSFQPEPSQLGPLQLGPSQPSPSQPGPSQRGPSQVSVPTPPLKRRQCKRKVNDISTKAPSPCNSSTNHHEPAATKERRRRSKANDMVIDPPYPWSKNRRAKIHTMEYLRSNNIVTITGEVECNQCKEKYEMEYDLVSKFEEITRFVARNGEDCNDRAPSSWATPIPLNCRLCNQQNCVEAVIPKSNFETINWLFLLLGQMLGNLQLEQLKYFCTNTNNHRTGAKDRLLYLTYITLCKQLNG